MSQSGSTAVSNTTEYQAEAILGSLVINGDISKLTEPQKVEYYKIYCRRVGLDPMTQPFKVLRTDGKETLYCDRSGTAQLNKQHNVSHKITAREEVDNCYLVTAQASTPDGRVTESIGAVPLLKENGEWQNSASGRRFFKGNGTFSRLQGEAFCNALMKAETKAKRRATLDLMGLGILDESEIDNIAGAQTVDIPFEDVTGTSAQATPAPNKPASNSVNVANAVPDATAKPADPQVNINPFTAKYDSVGSIKLVLEQVTSKQQVLDLYYGNSALIDGDANLKKQFGDKRDVFVKAELEQQSQQQSAPKETITEEQVKAVCARINRGELTAYENAHSTFIVPKAADKTMWDFFTGIYKQAIKVTHKDAVYVEFLIRMAQNVEHLDTIYKSNMMIVDREAGMKEKWNDKYQSLGHNGNTKN